MNVQPSEITAAVVPSPDDQVCAVVFPPPEGGVTRRLAVAYTTSSNGRFAWARLMPEGWWNFDGFCEPEELVEVWRIMSLVRFRMLAYCEGLGLVESWELREQLETPQR